MGSQELRRGHHSATKPLPPQLCRPFPCDVNTTIMFSLSQQRPTYLPLLQTRKNYVPNLIPNIVFKFSQKK